MPMKLNVGLSRKVGQPDFGSVGASCHVELELEGSLLQNDLDAFHRHVRTAFVACTQAVNDELARHGEPVASANTAVANGQQAKGRSVAGHAANGRNGQEPPRRSKGRSATASQVKAIYAIARSQGVDLAQALQDRYSVGRPDDLSVIQASELIDTMKGSANGSGGH